MCWRNLWVPAVRVGIDVGMGREEADALDDALREIRQSAWRLVQPEASKVAGTEGISETHLNLIAVVPQEDLRDISVQVQA